MNSYVMGTGKIPFSIHSIKKLCSLKKKEEKLIKNYEFLIIVYQYRLTYSVSQCRANCNFNPRGAQCSTRNK